jgi:hypothetical protein
MAKLLTRKEFLKKFPGGNYRQYLKKQRAEITRKQQQAKKAKAKKKKQYDYLKAVPPEALRTEAQQYLSSIFDPQMEALKQAYSGQLQQGSGLLSGIASQASQMLAPMAGQVGQFYGQAQGQQQAADQALYSQLMSGASQVGGDIASQLAAAGQDVGPGFDVGQIGAGAAGTVGAVGNAALSQLLGQGAAAQSYAAQLPGIAKMQGLSDVGLLTGQIGRAQTEALRGLEAEMPGLSQQIFQSLQERELQKATTRLGFATDIRQMKAEQQAAAAERAWREQQAAIDRALKIELAGIHESAADRRQRERLEAEAKKGGKGGKGKAAVRDRRRKALDRAIEMASQYATGDIGTTVIPPPYEGAEPGEKKASGQATMQAVQGLLRTLLPQATSQMIVNLASQAMQAGGWVYRLGIGWVIIS